ncbi:hypothetical protein ACHAWF_016646 [Thalassiosira exigua]
MDPSATMRPHHVRRQPVPAAQEAYYSRRDPYQPPPVASTSHHAPEMSAYHCGTTLVYRYDPRPPRSPPTQRVPVAHCRSEQVEMDRAHVPKTRFNGTTYYHKPQTIHQPRRMNLQGESGTLDHAEDVPSSASASVPVRVVDYTPDQVYSHSVPDYGSGPGAHHRHHHHMYHSHRRYSVSPPRHAPFAAASRSQSPHYYPSGPPPPGDPRHHASHVPPHHQGRPYHHQHYDPRVQMDAPQPTKHWPAPIYIPMSREQPASRESYLPHEYSHHQAHDMPAQDPVPAPGRTSPKEAEAAAAIAGLRKDWSNVKPSPLGLITTVSTSPPLPECNEASPTDVMGFPGEGTSYFPPSPEGNGPHHTSAQKPNRHSNTYSPPESRQPSPTHMQDANLDCKYKTEPEEDDKPAVANSFLPVDLILTAASTLDSKDSKPISDKPEGGKRKRQKVIDYTGRQNKKPNLKDMQSRFSVGEYPPGFDPSTLPPPPRKGGITAARKKDPNEQGDKDEPIDDETVTQAQKASLLAEQALARPKGVGKRLLLSMAMVRTSPRTPPSVYPSHGSILTYGFHWSAFPPLDNLLRKNMKMYYELSTNSCQSREQQEFNNELVHRVKEEAARYGWEFCKKAFEDDRNIRHRIRCFFKIHIQNAKKRLKTMLRNPEKPVNLKALADHFHLIEGAEAGVEHEHE